jgi:hypothetical protein
MLALKKACQRLRRSRRGLLDLSRNCVLPEPLLDSWSERLREDAIEEFVIKIDNLFVN